MYHGNWKSHRKHDISLQGIDKIDILYEWPLYNYDTVIP